MVNHCQAEIRVLQSHQNLHAGVVSITDQEMIGITTELLANAVILTISPSFLFVQVVKTGANAKTTDTHMKKANVSGQPKMYEEFTSERIIANQLKFVQMQKPSPQLDFLHSMKAASLDKPGKRLQRPLSPRPKHLKELLLHLRDLLNQHNQAN